jgi:hypothetical protein
MLDEAREAYSILFSRGVELDESFNGSVIGFLYIVWKKTSWQLALQSMGPYTFTADSPMRT